MRRAHQPSRSRLRSRSIALASFAVALALGCGTSPSTTVAPPSAKCATCHLADYQATTHPPHPGVRPTTCATCHSSSSWHPDHLVHSWPLQGVHAKTDCFGCHQGEPRQFEGTPKECVRCHVKDGDRANTRVEHHSQFPDTCQTCHTPAGWKPTLPHDEPPPDDTSNVATPPVSNAPSGTSAPATKKAAAPAKKPVPTPTRVPAPHPDTVTGASRPWHK